MTQHLETCQDEMWHSLTRHLILLHVNLTRSPLAPGCPGSPGSPFGPASPGGPRVPGAPISTESADAPCCVEKQKKMEAVHRFSYMLNQC